MYLYLGLVRPGGARARYSCSLYITQFFNSSNRLFTQSFISSLSFSAGSIRGRFEPRLAASLCRSSSSSRSSRGLRGGRLVFNLKMRIIFVRLAVAVTDLSEYHVHDAAVQDVLNVSHSAVSLQTALTAAVGLGLQFFHNFSGVHILIILINSNFFFLLRLLLSLLGFLDCQLQRRLRLLNRFGFLSHCFDRTGLASLHDVILLDLGQMSLQIILSAELVVTVGAVEYLKSPRERDDN